MAVGLNLLLGLLAKNRVQANEPVEPGDVPYNLYGEGKQFDPSGLYRGGAKGVLSREPFTAEQNWASRLLGQENLGERANVAVLSQLAQQRLLSPGALEQMEAEEGIKTRSEIGRKRKEAELEQEFAGKKAENAVALTLATRYGLSGDAAKELAPLLSAKAKSELAKESAVDVGVRQKAEIETERAAKTRGTELGTAEATAKSNAEIANRWLQLQTDPTMQDVFKAGMIGETLTPAARVVSGLDVGIGPGQVFQRPSIPGISRVIPGGAGLGATQVTPMQEIEIGGKKIQIPSETRTTIPGFYRPNLTYSPEEIQQIIGGMAAQTPQVGVPQQTTPLTQNPPLLPSPVRRMPGRSSGGLPLEGRFGEMLSDEEIQQQKEARKRQMELLQRIIRSGSPF